MADSSHRLLLVDDNIRAMGGHFLELASLLIKGARELGYATDLATHVSFRDRDSVDLNSRLIPALRSRRMVRWSLGVDGRSRVRRDLQGRPVGQGRLARSWHTLRDPLCRPDRRPQVMLDRWSEDLLRVLTQWRPRKSDALLINTGDDFVMLGLARALSQLKLPSPLSVHVIFHFAVIDGIQVTSRGRQFGEQVNDALAATKPHQVHLHATTQALASQLRDVGVQAKAVPYPTRNRPVVDYHPPHAGCLKMLMAGMPRAEKGRSQIRSLLSAIEQPLLQRGRYRVSMQMPQKRWQRMIPSGLRVDYHDALRDNPRSDNPLEILCSDLSSQTYHAWLDTADVGMFLYDPARYLARCSGVLLEMFVRGIPVIVPDQCWLADQVRLAASPGPVGYIYRSIDEIPELLNRASEEYVELRRRAIDYAKVIARRHSASNTLLEMGLADANRSDRRMAS